MSIVDSQVKKCGNDGIIFTCMSNKHRTNIIVDEFFKNRKAVNRCVGPADESR